MRVDGESLVLLSWSPPPRHVFPIPRRSTCCIAVMRLLLPLKKQGGKMHTRWMPEVFMDVHKTPLFVTVWIRSLARLLDLKCSHWDLYLSKRETKQNPFSFTYREKYSPEELLEGATQSRIPSHLNQGQCWSGCSGSNEVTPHHPGMKRASLELQPAEMSTKKAALGCVPPSLLVDVPCTFPRRLHPSFGSIAGACRKRLRQCGQASQASTGEKVWPPQKRLERCPSRPGLGMPPPCQAGSCWGLWGLAGKPHGKRYNITPSWTTATPHATPTSPWRGTFNSFAWSCAHLQTLDFLLCSGCSGGRTWAEPEQSLGFTDSVMSQTEATHIPASPRGPVAVPWSFMLPHTSMWDCYQHCLDLTQSNQICALREPVPLALCASASWVILQESGTRRSEELLGMHGAPSTLHCTGPLPTPKCHGEHISTRVKSEYQRYESCPDRSGLQSLIKMIKRLQGQAGWLAHSWKHWWGHWLGWFFTAKTCKLGKVCLCPLLWCSCCSFSRCLGFQVHRPGTERVSAGAQVPDLPGAWLTRLALFL